MTDRKWQDHAKNTDIASLPKRDRLHIKIIRHYSRFMEICYRLNLRVDEASRAAIFATMRDKMVANAGTEHQRRRKESAIRISPEKAELFVGDVMTAWAISQKVLNGIRPLDYTIAVPDIGPLPRVKGIGQKIVRECEEFMRICYSLGVEIDEQSRPHVFNVIGRAVALRAEETKKRADAMRREATIKLNADPARAEAASKRMTALNQARSKSDTTVEIPKAEIEFALIDLVPNEIPSERAV